MQKIARTSTLVELAVPGAGFLRDALVIAGFTAFIAVFAQIAIRLPFSPVPITGQTLAVLLTGAALGSKRGALSMLLYMLLGVLGSPVFAPSPSALANETVHFILPWKGTASPIWVLGSGGYIVGFVVAAYVVGYLAERGWDRKARVIGAMLLGNIIIYLFGLPWLSYFIATNKVQITLGSSVLDKTLVGGFYPYIPGDILKTLLASFTLPGAWEIVGRVKKQNSHPG